jgi:putative FmdB family regulatory protein
MPLYEFRCDKCQEVIERLCPVGTNGKGLKCPGCGGRKMRRLMSVFAALTKGDDGAATARSGSSCASCTSSSCASCH